MSGWTHVTLVYAANATGARTPAQIATALGDAWDAIDKALITTVYGCTIASATTAVTGTQASLTVVIDLSDSFLAGFPAVDLTSDTSPFVELFTAELRAAIAQPDMAATPDYGGS
jgi:hypothetical protein